MKVYFILLKKLHITLRFGRLYFSKIPTLTQSPHKVQPMSRYRFSNFWIFFCLTSLSWCLNYINIRLTPLRPPLIGVQVAPKFQKWKNCWHFIEMVLGGIVLVLFAHWRLYLGIGLYSLIAEKTENFYPILFLGIFKLDFRIPGPILSGILLQYMSWCLVTPMTPRGSLRSQNTRTCIATKFHSKFCQESENKV